MPPDQFIAGIYIPANPCWCNSSWKCVGGQKSKV